MTFRLEDVDWLTAAAIIALIFAVIVVVVVYFERSRRG
jgi:hypothetical protein